MNIAAPIFPTRLVIRDSDPLEITNRISDGSVKNIAIMIFKI